MILTRGTPVYKNRYKNNGIGFVNLVTGLVIFKGTYLFTHLNNNYNQFNDLNWFIISYTIFVIMIRIWCTDV